MYFLPFISCSKYELFIPCLYPMPSVFLAFLYRHHFSWITSSRNPIRGTSEAVTSIRPIFKCGCFTYKGQVRCWYPSSPQSPASLQAFYYLQRIISVILTLIFLTSSGFFTWKEHANKNTEEFSKERKLARPCSTPGITKSRRRRRTTQY